MRVKVRIRVLMIGKAHKPIIHVSMMGKSRKLEGV